MTCMMLIGLMLGVIVMGWLDQYMALVLTIPFAWLAMHGPIMIYGLLTGKIKIDDV